ncbi:ADP-ribose pyrophosphatase YjhB, NUDIX family [Tenacibaculum sp. MAR_2009_124]|uniref:NUDIX hydrolase n=1 Tax=Tenacibaculum sp. MAR_2009_124 TaxID=1250059 RepID=UPI00089C74A5|nr:NUDIX domain-containing protein [Tenacibaculum sp. MAR_2009_124]SEB36738.1 ADP-ribose pyrophosphatase YjhB, NUDIX family [Tenacibaculum sp. MAR_2009_124]
MKEIDKIAYIEIKDGQILSTRSKGKDKYYIPGGKRDEGENDEETLIREIFEELKVTIDKETIKYVGTFKAQADGATDGVLVKMTCYEAEYSGTLVASSEIEELKWLSFSDIDLVSEVDKIIFNSLKEKGKLR